MNDVDLALALLRVMLGIIFIAHGYNHGFGAGGLDGTTRWFESIGLRPARLQAAVSSYLELAAGAALIAGFLTTAASAAGIGMMATAFVTVHRPKGFFIFKEGYEYVILLAVTLTSLAILGPGEWSLDHALNIDMTGLGWGLGAAGLGLLGTGGMLAACWHPDRADR